jgi:GT2 family glycosyltransferase
MRWDIRHVDLKQGTPTFDGGADPIYAIFWWGDLPVGAQTFAAEELPLRRDLVSALAARLLAAQIATRSEGLGGAATARIDGRAMIAPHLSSIRDLTLTAEHLSALDLAALFDAEDLSVVVCTCDRIEHLRNCLTALTMQVAPPGEILVVDNSGSGSAATVCEDFKNVRYVHEPSPGLSRARNRGLVESTRPLIAFTDDDVEVHARWSGEVVRAFQESDAEALTGLVIPAALETDAQGFFQFGMGGFGTSYVPTRFDQVLFDETRHRGTQVWRIGAGANMAFRREIFQAVGTFDERLGAGAAGCSEDSELWYRILAAGGTCLYEPRAVVFHHHREDWVGLRRQMRAYMRGHVAALIVQYDRHGRSGNRHRMFRQLPRYFINVAINAIRNGKTYRWSVLMEEVLGWAGGLTFLLRPRWRSQRSAPSMPPAKQAV